MAESAQATSGVAGRIESLDQFRGWAIFTMVMVNCLGNFDSMPEAFRHHREGMTYADMAVPAFLFAVGMGFRLSFLRRMKKQGIWRARLAALRRYLLLIAIGCLVYGHGIDYTDSYWFWRSFHKNFWDALVDIGFSGLLALPFIERGPALRLAMGVVYCGIFQAAYDFAGYDLWVMRYSLQGGPLGVLTHAFPLLLGTVAYDLLALNDRKRLLRGGLALGLGTMAAGYAMSYRWVFSMRYGTASYFFFASGICMLVYLGFYLLADVAKISVPTFTAMGRNALTLYIAQQLLLELYELPEYAPAALAVAIFFVLYGSLYGVARYLDRSGYYIRL